MQDDIKWDTPKVALPTADEGIQWDEPATKDEGIQWDEPDKAAAPVAAKDEGIQWDEPAPVAKDDGTDDGIGKRFALQSVKDMASSAATANKVLGNEKLQSDFEGDITKVEGREYQWKVGQAAKYGGKPEDYWNVAGGFAQVAPYAIGGAFVGWSKAAKFSVQLASNLGRSLVADGVTATVLHAYKPRDEAIKAIGFEMATGIFGTGIGQLFSKYAVKGFKALGSKFTMKPAIKKVKELKLKGASDDQVAEAILKNPEDFGLDSTVMKEIDTPEMSTDEALDVLVRKADADRVKNGIDPLQPKEIDPVIGEGHRAVEDLDEVYTNYSNEPRGYLDPVETRAAGNIGKTKGAETNAAAGERADGMWTYLKGSNVETNHNIGTKGSWESQYSFAGKKVYNAQTKSPAERELVLRVMENKGLSYEMALKDLGYDVILDTERGAAKVLTRMDALPNSMKQMTENGTYAGYKNQRGINAETVQSRKTARGDEIIAKGPEFEQQYTTEIQKIVGGTPEEMAGIKVDSDTAGVGFFEGHMGPMNNLISDAPVEKVRLAAAIRGFVTRQDSVPITDIQWRDIGAKDVNTIGIHKGIFTPAEASAMTTALDKSLGVDKYAFVSTKEGANILNFGWTGNDLAKFTDAVTMATPQKWRTQFKHGYNTVADTIGYVSDDLYEGIMKQGGVDMKAINALRAQVDDATGRMLGDSPSAIKEGAKETIKRTNEESLLNENLYANSEDALKEANKRMFKAKPDADAAYKKLSKADVDELNRMALDEEADKLFVNGGNASGGAMGGGTLGGAEAAYEDIVEGKNLTGAQYAARILGGAAAGAGLGHKFGGKAGTKMFVGARANKKEAFASLYDHKNRAWISDEGAKLKKHTFNLSNSASDSYDRIPEVIKGLKESLKDILANPKFTQAQKATARKNAAIRIDRLEAVVPPTQGIDTGLSLNKHTLGDILDHPALYKRYPQLKKVDVMYDERLSPESAYFSPETNTMTLSKQISRISDTQKISTILHETQHKIQRMEGFAKGGSPETIGIEDVAAYVLRNYKGTKSLHNAAKMLTESKQDYIDLGYSYKDYDELYDRNLQYVTDYLRNMETMTGSTSELKFKMYKALMGEQEARATQAAFESSQLDRMGVQEDVARTLKEAMEDQASDDWLTTDMPIYKLVANSLETGPIRKHTAKIAVQGDDKIKAFLKATPEERIKLLKLDTEGLEPYAALKASEGDKLPEPIVRSGVKDEMMYSMKQPQTEIPKNAVEGFTDKVLKAAGRGALKAADWATGGKVHGAYKALKENDQVDWLVGHKIYNKKDYMAIREKTLASVNAVSDKAEIVHEQLKLLSSGAREGIYDYMTGVKDVELSPALKKLGDHYIAEIDGMGKQLVDDGILSKEAYEEWAGQYLHRKYTPKLGKKIINATAGNRGFGIDQIKARGKHWIGSQAEVDELLKSKQGVFDFASTDQIAKPSDKVGRISDGKIRITKLENGKYELRRDWTPAERKAMGEIKDAAYSVPETMLRLSTLTEYSKMMKAVPEKYMAPIDTKFTPEALKQQGYNQLSGSKYGVLNGRWMQKDMASDITATTRMFEDETIAQNWQTYVRAVKGSHTIYNPTAHFNNYNGNAIMQWMAGLNPLKAYKYSAQMATKYGDVARLKTLNAKSIVGLTAKEATERRALIRDPDLKLWGEGAAQGLFGRSRLNDVLNQYVSPQMDLAQGTIAKIRKGAQITYQAEDDVMRFSALKQLTEKGFTVEDAVKKINNDIIPDYSKPMSRGGEGARRSGIVPFISWQYYSTPMLIKQMKDNPTRAMLLYGALEAVNRFSDINDGEDMPYHGKGYKGKVTAIPFMSSGDKKTVWRHGNTVPHNQIFEPLETGRSMAAGGIPQQMLGAMLGMGEGNKIQNLFFGSPVTYRKGVAGAYDATKHVVQNLGPTPDILDKGYNLAEAAIFPKKRRKNPIVEPRTPAQEFLNLFGLNTKTYSLSAAQKHNKKDGLKK